jgi:hypothetical protein
VRRKAERPHREEARGVQLREVDGQRSSQRVGRAVFGDAARYVDASLADDIGAIRDWRKGYLGPVRRLVELGAGSAKDALRIASDGIESLHRNLEWVGEGEPQTLREALAAPGSDGVGFKTEVVTGRGTAHRELTIPFRGELLRGEALERKLDDWRDRGIIERSCADAVALVAANPAWLDLSDQHVAYLGTAAEMGPLPALSRWGANIYAVELPVRRLWERVLGAAREGTGRLFAPVRAATGAGDLTESAGANLLYETPAIRAWLDAATDQPLHVADFTYADGTTFLRVAGAADALIADLMSARRLRSLGYLATPTDVFAVPQEVVDAARAATGRGPGRTVLRATSARRLYVPNYRETVRSEDGHAWGISDCLIPQQGPNYALAKNAQRWRAALAREARVRVSLNVAPATRTASVTRNRILASAYRGAGAFGVEIFEPETSSWLMAALLVHDLRNPSAPSNPHVELSHPFDLTAQGAAHGGVWRLPYEPRTVLPLALVRGIVRRPRPARPR